MKNQTMNSLKNLFNPLPIHKKIVKEAETSPEQALRAQIASSYLLGNGIEIGALHSPLNVPHHVTVKYVDRMSVPELRKQYPKLKNYKLVEVDIIDDGERLNSIPDASVDFVIANHMIEHCQNPISAMEQHLRVLRHHGILYMAVPDMRYTFDRDRAVTSLEHLIKDYTEGPEWSMKSHFEDWVRLREKVPEDRVTPRVQYLMSIDYSIHFHVWRQIDFFELLLYCQNDLSFPFEIELIQKIISLNLSSFLASNRLNQRFPVALKMKLI
ncbi:Methyltransferase type 11 [Halothece sp. PCC 7418]|nr:Methyltransferase type 11 [Halothece sp. PCC 7418]